MCIVYICGVDAPQGATAASFFISNICPAPYTPVPSPPRPAPSGFVPVCCGLSWLAPFCSSGPARAVQHRPARAPPLLDLIRKICHVYYYCSCHCICSSIFWGVSEPSTGCGWASLLCQDKATLLCAHWRSQYVSVLSCATKEPVHQSEMGATVSSPSLSLSLSFLPLSPPQCRPIPPLLSLPLSPSGATSTN